MHISSGISKLTPELSKLAGNQVVEGSSWLIPLRSDWPNEKQVASVDLLRDKLYREFFDLRSVPAFLARPNLPDTTSESRRDGVKVAQDVSPG
jgi:hypothetical protein